MDRQEGDEKMIDACGEKRQLMIEREEEGGRRGMLGCNRAGERLKGMRC